MKRNPGINWFVGVNYVYVMREIEEVGLPTIVPKSLTEGFARWAAGQRIKHDANLQEEASEYIKNTYAKNLSWLNAKNKNNLFGVVSTRDGSFCAECFSKEDLTLDHIKARSRGGPDTPENLQILCRKCNSSKGAS